MLTDVQFAQNLMSDNNNNWHLYSSQSKCVQRDRKFRSVKIGKTDGQTDTFKVFASKILHDIPCIVFVWIFQQWQSFLF